VIRRDGIALARGALERWVLALAEIVVVPNVVASVVDIESSVPAAQLAKSCVEHMLLLGRRGGVCKMALGKRGSLLKLMSSCLGCSGGSPVCPSGEEFGKSGLESGSCSKLLLLGCSARERSMRREREGWVPGASSGLGDHVQQWNHCSSELRRRGCVGDHNLVALDTHRSDDDQSRQRNVLDACGAHLASHVLRPGRSEAIAFDWSAAAWMEIHHCLIQRSHHRLFRKNGCLVGGIVVGA
jgi:hypothetical protein